MIPVKFPPLAGELRTYLLAHTVGVAVRREEPAEAKPQKLVVLSVANGRRINEVSRLVRVTARIRCAFPAPNDNLPDFDTTSATAAQVVAILERAPAEIARIQETTDSNGPLPVKDERDFEFQTAFIEYQVRGSSI